MHNVYFLLVFNEYILYFLFVVTMEQHLLRQLDAHRELSDIGNLVVASQTLKHAVLLLRV